MRRFAALIFISIAGVASAQQGAHAAAPAAQMFGSVGRVNSAYLNTPMQPIPQILPAVSSPPKAAPSANGGGCARQCAVLRGAGIGLAVGAVGGGLYGAHLDRTDNFGASAVGPDVAFGGALGVFVGAIVGALWPLSGNSPIVASLVPTSAHRGVSRSEWRICAHVGL